VKNAVWMLLLLAASRSDATETYPLDSSNTRVSFAVQRLGILWATAHFADISGQLTLDRSGAESRVDVSVGIASLECNEPRWSERLRSAEWLDANRYPLMIFHSSRIEWSGDHAVARGELTLHGTTQPMVLVVSLESCAAAGNCQFSAHGQIRRSEYGLPHGFWTGGDQVDIYISGSVSGQPR
jgi:polyisoprenoid-binding protein YceI